MLWEYPLNKENLKYLNIANVASDALLVLVAMLLSYFLRFVVFDGTEAMSLGFYVLSALGISLLYMLLFALLGLYESQRSANLLKLVQTVLLISLFCTAVLATVFFTSRKINVSRWLLLLFFFWSSLLLSAKRLAMYKLLRRARARGYNAKYVLLAGSGDNAREYLEAVKQNPWLGYNVLGSVGCKSVTEELFHLGDFDELEHILLLTRADELVAALDIDEFSAMPAVVAACEKYGIKFSLIPYFSSYIVAHPHIDEVGSVPLINLRRVPLDNIVNAAVKRCFDIVCALLLILLTSPLMLTAAIGTRITLGNPVLFRQTRVGYRRQNFTMLKFRSMRDAAPGDSSGWSSYQKSRVTPFGRFLRKSSIDELPQLFNVLRGDMSLIGPRPELPKYVELFREKIPLYMVKHQVRPGMTGWAQVNGFRGDTSLEDRIHCDIYYIENWTFLLDLKILFMTPFHFTENGDHAKDEQEQTKRKEPAKADDSLRRKRAAAQGGSQQRKKRNKRKKREKNGKHKKHR